MTLARDYLNRQISVYRNASDTKEGVDRTVRSVLEDTRDSKLAGLVADVRRLHQAIPALPDGLLPDDRKGIAAWKQSDPAAHGIWDKASKKYNAAKSRLLPFTTAGTFRPGHRHGETPTPKHLKEYPECCTTGLLEHSGLVIEDLDHLAAHGADQELLLEQFAAHPAVIGAFVSPSDDGIKVIMAVDPVPWDDESHVRGWAGGRDALAGIYTHIDESGKNISRYATSPTARAATSPPTTRSSPPPGWQNRNPLQNRRKSPGQSRGAAPAGSQPLTKSGLPWTIWPLRASAPTTTACCRGHVHAVHGLTFDEFDEWAAAAGCSCTNRRTRWDSFKNSDKDYSAIIGMAVKRGWKRAPARKPSAALSLRRAGSARTQLVWCTCSGSWAWKSGSTPGV